MAANRSNREAGDIDEGFLLQSIKKQDGEPKAVEEQPPSQVTVEPVPEKPEEIKEPSRRKKSANTDYGSQFLKRNEFKARQCVYISQRIHAAISEIVKVISDKDMTVGGYIDSILSEHLETHREEITKLYNSELSKKYGKSPFEF